jgi:hypothetical protein
MSEPVAEETASPVETGATQRLPQPRNARRTQLLTLLRTQDGRRQAFLIADILALPLAMRPHRAVEAQRRAPKIVPRGK